MADHYIQPDLFLNSTPEESTEGSVTSETGLNKSAAEAANLGFSAECASLIDMFCDDQAELWEWPKLFAFIHMRFSLALSLFSCLRNSSTDVIQELLERVITELQDRDRLELSDSSEINLRGGYSATYQQSLSERPRHAFLTAEGIPGFEDVHGFFLVIFVLVVLAGPRGTKSENHVTVFCSTMRQILWTGRGRLKLKEADLVEIREILILSADVKDAIGRIIDFAEIEPESSLKKLGKALQAIAEFVPGENTENPVQLEVGEGLWRLTTKIWIESQVDTNPFGREDSGFDSWLDGFLRNPSVGKEIQRGYMPLAFILSLDGLRKNLSHRDLQDVLNEAAINSDVYWANRLLPIRQGTKKILPSEERLALSEYFSGRLKSGKFDELDFLILFMLSLSKSCEEILQLRCGWGADIRPDGTIRLANMAVDSSICRSGVSSPNCLGVLSSLVVDLGGLASPAICHFVTPYAMGETLQSILGIDSLNVRSRIRRRVKKIKKKKNLVKLQANKLSSQMRTYAWVSVRRLAEVYLLFGNEKMGVPNMMKYRRLAAIPLGENFTAILDGYFNGKPVADVKKLTGSVDDLPCVGTAIPDPKPVREIVCQKQDVLEAKIKKRPRSPHEWWDDLNHMTYLSLLSDTAARANKSTFNFLWLSLIEDQRVLFISDKVSCVWDENRPVVYSKFSESYLDLISRYLPLLADYVYRRGHHNLAGKISALQSPKLTHENQPILDLFSIDIEQGVYTPVSPRSLLNWLGDGFSFDTASELRKVYGAWATERGLSEDQIRVQHGHVYTSFPLFSCDFTNCVGSVSEDMRPIIDEYAQFVGLRKLEVPNVSIEQSSVVPIFGRGSVKFPAEINRENRISNFSSRLEDLGSKILCVRRNLTGENYEY